MKWLLLPGFVAGALFGGPAMAADLSRPAPAVVAPAAPPIFSWTGFYIGANAGYSWGKGKDAADFYGLDPSGWSGGGQVGYNYQFVNNVLIGVEADLQGSDISSSTLGLSSKLDYFGTVRARLGYAFDRVLPYVTGGLAYGKNTITDFGFSDSNTHVGWTVGAGLEYAMTNNWTARAEYLYTDLGTKTYDNIGDAGVTSSTARLGVNYKF
ncbi:outer membrane protein [Xanthobacter sp. DSM 24535]|uniref:outer membrane protein n=1 Tax=Roseixanthobacter psychrophilus TaxID=3119917 RepID=UPI0037287E35